MLVGWRLRLDSRYMAYEEANWSDRLECHEKTLRRETALELRAILYLPIARGNDLDGNCLYLPAMIYFHSHVPY